MRLPLSLVGQALDTVCMKCSSALIVLRAWLRESIGKVRALDVS